MYSIHVRQCTNNVHCSSISNLRSYSKNITKKKFLDISAELHGAGGQIAIFLLKNAILGGSGHFFKNHFIQNSAVTKNTPYPCFKKQLTKIMIL